jgi:hypothetical protein
MEFAKNTHILNFFLKNYLFFKKEKGILKILIGFNEKS